MNISKYYYSPKEETKMILVHWCYININIETAFQLEMSIR